MPAGKGVKLWFYWMSCHTCHTDTEEQRREGGQRSHRKQELMASLQGLLQPCPNGGGFLVPNQHSPFKNHVSKVLL